MIDLWVKIEVDWVGVQRLLELVLPTKKQSIRVWQTVQANFVQMGKRNGLHSFAEKGQRFCKRSENCL
jgi:hypothetical protein